MPNTSVTDLTAALAAGEVEVVDLTQPLSETHAGARPAATRSRTRRTSRAASSATTTTSAPPGPGASSSWASTPAPTSTRRSTGSPARTASTSPRSRPRSSSARSSSIDKTAEVEADNGYLLTAADLDAFEAENGPIQPGSWLLFRTGWESRAQDEASFLNLGPEGPISPGPDVAGSKWLAEHPNIVGFGCETVGIDAGSAGGMDPGFPVHNFLLGAGPLRPHPAGEPDEAADHRRADRRRPAEAGRRHRQPLARPRLRPPLGRPADDRLAAAATEGPAADPILASVLQRRVVRRSRRRWRRC